MENLPIPILGEITAFAIASPDLEKSLAFYQKLGFTELMRADWPFPWIQVTDGVVLIMLRMDPKPYIALTYYSSDINKVVADLDKKGVQFIQRAKKTDSLKRFVFQSPDGLTISLVGITEGFSQPPGPGMLNMPQEDYFNPERYVNKTAGLYGEFAHPVTDLDKSLEFWALLGFKAVSRFTSPYPWAIISDGLSVVGLHQTDHFSSPTITYFAADMANKIKKIKAAGIKDFKDQGGGNIILATPEKQYINLFQLGGGTPETKKKKKPELKQVVLETERLLLKELSPEIIAELFTSYSDEEIMHHMGLSTNEELEKERSNFKMGLANYRTTLKSFMLFDKKSGKAIGKSGFHNWHKEHSRAEVGYRMFDETMKGKGLMTEALGEILRYGFEEMKLNRIEAFVGLENEPSQRLMKRYKFTREGIFRSHFFKNGKMEDSICFSLLQNEYSAGKAKSRKAKK